MPADKARGRVSVFLAMNDLLTHGRSIARREAVGRASVARPLSGARRWPGSEPRDRLIAVVRNVAAACLVFLVIAAAAAAAGAGVGPLAWPKGAGTSVVGVPVTANQFAVVAIDLDSHAVLQHRVVLLGDLLGTP